MLSLGCVLSVNNHINQHLNRLQLKSSGYITTETTWFLSLNQETSLPRILKAHRDNRLIRGKCLRPIKVTKVGKESP